jgi:glycosyltransferase involved in cell wall biosynthesis
VISDSHAIAKGARKRPGAIHVSYCHTPARFAWTMPELYAARAAAGSGPLRGLATAALSRFRRWDLAATQRVDKLVANSQHIADAILRCYGVRAEVIHPPVDIARFASAATTRTDDYVTVSRLVPYKRVDLLVEAFRHQPERRLVVIGDGPERRRLAAAAPSNVEFTGRVDDADVVRYVAGAKAFVFAAQEDFGIALVEAQAAGTPVIACDEGGAREIVRGLETLAPTGVLYPAQTVDALVAALDRFDGAQTRIVAQACRDNAARFAPEYFRAAFAACVERATASRAEPS